VRVLAELEKSWLVGDSHASRSGGDHYYQAGEWSAKDATLRVRWLAGPSRLMHEELTMHLGGS
jgi:hypothetical protein